VGAIIAYGASFAYDVTFLLPFASGNIIYIAAADLIPEIKQHEDAQVNILHFLVLGRARAALGRRTDLRLRAPGRHGLTPILLRAE
jgi:zinc transporter ZupT